MPNNDSSPIHPDATLLQRLGGRETVWRVVDVFYDHVETDQELRAFFPAALQRGRNMQKLFLEEWLGGAPVYSQRGAVRSGMQSAHYRFVISKQAAGRWLHHMGNAFQECNVAPELVAEVMAALGPLAHLTVNEGENFDRVQEVLILASKGDLAAVQEAVERSPLLVSQKGTAGRTLLWEATRRGHRETVAFLLQRGAEVNAPGGAPVMVTPYALARTRGHNDLADDLLAHGAVVDVFTAAYLGDTEHLTTLLDDDPACVNSIQPAEDVNPVTPLYYAVSGGHLNAAQLLIARGAETTPDAVTLLTSLAASKGRTDLVDLLRTAQG